PADRLSGDKSATVARPKPGGDRSGNGGVPRRTAPINGDGPHCERLLRRGNPGDRRLVIAAAVIRTTRRAFLTGAAAVLLPKPSVAQSKPRIVVVGGGFAGATCARALRHADPRLDVTLVEPNSIFTACPFSNAVIAGLRDMAAQRFGYDAIRKDGVAVA